MFIPKMLDEHYFLIRLIFQAIILFLLLSLELKTAGYPFLGGLLLNLLCSTGSVFFCLFTGGWPWICKTKKEKAHPDIKGAYLKEDLDEHLSAWFRSFAFCQEPVIVAMSYAIYSGFVLSMISGSDSGIRTGIYLMAAGFILACPAILKADRKLNEVDAKFELREQTNEIASQFIESKKRDQDELVKTILHHLDKKQNGD